MDNHASPLQSSVGNPVVHFMSKRSNRPITSYLLIFPFASSNQLGASSIYSHSSLRRILSCLALKHACWIMIPLDTPGNRRGAFAPKQKMPPVNAQLDPLKLMVLPEKSRR